MEKTNTTKILEIIQRMSPRFDAIPVYDICDEAEQAGINTNETVMILGKLSLHGEIFYPRHGLIKLVTKR